MEDQLVELVTTVCAVVLTVAYTIFAYNSLFDFFKYVNVKKCDEVLMITNHIINNIDSMQPDEVEQVLRYCESLNFNVKVFVCENGIPCVPSNQQDVK